MRKALVKLAGVSAVAAAVASGAGASGQIGSGLVPQGAPGQVRAPGQSVYTITPQAGKYLIFAACYDGHVYGDQTRAKAEELVQEIRTQFGLPAYVFNRADEERRKEKERTDAILDKWKKDAAQQGALPDSPPPRIGRHRIVDEYAVLVGGYNDDVTARKKLDEIRKLQPSQKLMHTAIARDAAGKAHEQAVNPFQSAFVCRNPSIPIEKPATDNDTEQRLKEYNAGEKYSLLKCPKPYTLVVKSYQGAAVVQAQSASSSVMDKAWGVFGKKGGDVLNANARQAHQAAEFLRNKQPGLDFEAYVLHTEYSSYVTIGAFDSPDDPKLDQVRRAFVNEMNRPSSGVSQLHARTQFFTEPMPMQVPKVK